MNKFNKTKYLLGGVIISLLTACGGENYEAPTRESNVGPVSDGNVTLNLNETEGYTLVNLISGVTDADFDYLHVANLQKSISASSNRGAERQAEIVASLEGGVGFDNQVSKIGIRLQDIRPLIDTDESIEVIYSFQVSDGRAAVDKTLTINVTGVDSAPTFNDDVFALKTNETATDDNQVNLFDSVVDLDGEVLSIGNFEPDSNFLSNFYTLGDDGVITLNLPAILDSLAEGEAQVYRASYTVDDHRFQVPRNVSVVVAKLTDVPLAPGIIAPAEVAVGTDSAVRPVDLASPAYVIEPNGEDIGIDWSSITPVDTAPPLKFSKSADTTLMIDPVDFATLLDTGETASYTYNYSLNDGDGGFTVDASFTIHVTKEEPAVILANGGFEDSQSATRGWSISGLANGVTVSTASSADLDFQGSSFVSLAAATDDETANISVSPALDVGSSYYVAARQSHFETYGGSQMTVTGEIAGVANTEIIRSIAFAHGVNPRTYVMAFDAVPNITINYSSGPDVVEMDDVVVGRYTSDQGRNLISEDNSTFENGAGDWILTDTTMVVDGKLQITAADARETLALPAGTIENGKKYLLTFDVESNAAAGVLNKIRVSIVTPGDNDTTASGPSALYGMGEIAGGVSTYSRLIDVNRNTDIEDWSSRDLELHLGVNVWGGGSTFLIDNILLVEVE